MSELKLTQINAIDRSNEGRTELQTFLRTASGNSITARISLEANQVKQLTVGEIENLAIAQVKKDLSI